MVETVEVANFVIQTAMDQGEDLPNLRLQMVLFNLQGWYLNKYNKRLFDSKISNDEFYKWPFIPNCKSLYALFRDYGSASITDTWVEAYFDEHDKFVVVKHELKDEALKRELKHEILRLLQYCNWQYTNIVKYVLKREGFNSLNKDKNSVFNDQEITIWYKIFSKKLDI